MTKLTDREILLITEYYIGVDGGYLGHFHDRRTLREFYQVDCDLDINPSYEYSGTIREEFIDILKSQSTRGQARILRTVLEQFACESGWHEPPTTQEKLQSRLENVALRLESESAMVAISVPQTTSESVRASLEDAANSIHRGRVSHAVDRMHTALHAHIVHVCDVENIGYPDSPKVKTVFKSLLGNHPAFQTEGPRAHDINNILDKLSAVLDALNPIRNKASLSHPPQEALLAEAEATLAINATRSVFNYLEIKIQDYAEKQKQATYPAPDPGAVDDIPF